MKKIYLACPYTHESKRIEKKRFKAVTQVAGKLMNEGYLVYSPITHGHTICQYTKNMPTDFEYWQKHCLSFLDNWADELLVLDLDGYLAVEQSRGVNEEINYAKELNLPIEFTSLDTLKYFIEKK